jgi:phosphoribosyl-AMP cyclohydrolase
MSAPSSSTGVIEFGPDGLLPVVIQDATSDAVLMLAFMNAEALDLTRSTGRTHFWSRSRGRLWRKGETSGHEQIVEEIFVNCETNSLLITVQQIGAACHTGYPTCYYRRLEPDDSLTVVRDRWFDPADVYKSDGNSFAARTRLWYGAYEYLRDNDLAFVSGTSHRLRNRIESIAPRIADELRELAGVLTGAHVHSDQQTDALLEGTQSLYWLILAVVNAGARWDQVRPDRAMVVPEEIIQPQTAARMLSVEADSWEKTAASSDEIAARVHAAMALTPESLIERELADLQSRNYLATYFDTRESTAPEAGSIL